MLVCLIIKSSHWAPIGEIKYLHKPRGHEAEVFQAKVRNMLPVGVTFTPARNGAQINRAASRGGSVRESAGRPRVSPGWGPCWTLLDPDCHLLFASLSLRLIREYGEEKP